jgi:hypothetical protein
MLPLDGQETRAEKTNLTVDILTGFYARYRGLPSRFRNGPAAGQQTGRLSAPPGLPSVAISVGTTSMIAIPVAAFMGPVAMIVGPAPQIRCNDFGHGRPMIAIPPADDCGSLQIASVAVFEVLAAHFRNAAMCSFKNCASAGLSPIPAG